MCVHLCNVGRDGAENIEGLHTLVAATRHNDRSHCTYTLEQRFFHHSVAAPRVQIYSNILNLWDTSLNFSFHRELACVADPGFLGRRVKFRTHEHAREKKRREGLLFHLRVSHALYNNSPKKLTGVFHAGYGRIGSATFVPRRVAATCPPVCTGFDKEGFDSTAATSTRVVAYNIAEVDTAATFCCGKFWA